MERKLKDLPVDLGYAERTGLINEDTVINVNLGRKTLKPNNEFAMLFYKSLLIKMVTYELNATDVKVLLAILDYVGYGNVVSLTQSKIAYDLDMKKQNVNKSYTNLINAKLLIKDSKGSIFLNPQVLSKGRLRDLKNSQPYGLAENEGENANF
jgi:hypothetical protein